MATFFEGEFEHHNGTSRVRVRFCEGKFVIDTFKKDYPISTTNQEVIDDLTKHFGMEIPWLSVISLENFQDHEKAPSDSRGRDDCGGSGVCRGRSRPRLLWRGHRGHR